MAARIGDAVGAALQGLGHGDLYGHNALVHADGTCVLSDIGAAAPLPCDAGRAAALRAFDARALAILRQDLQACIKPAG